MAFIVEQEAFSGPLGLLLDLLRKNELDITKVNLAKIADDYLAYLDANQVPSVEMADFLVVASRLIYLKSRELMPYLRIDDEEEEAESLEDQLRLYRMFVEAAEKIEDQFASSNTMFHRPYVKLKPKQTTAFVAPENATGERLRDTFKNLLKKLEPFLALQETSIERVKSVEQRVDELRGAITSRAKMSFQDVVRSAKSKPEVVVSFLALLELMRRQLVKATQTKERDIIIERV